MAIETEEEAKFYVKEKEKAIEEISSKCWDTLIASLLRTAFRLGYEAKEYYDKR